MTLREEIERRRTFAIIAHPDAGKTTLTEILTKRYGAKAYYEDLANPYINDFYEDMGRWSFHLQLWFLGSRIQQTLTMLADESDNVVQDRTIYEDAHIFASNLQEMGLMTSRDFATYMRIFDLTTNLIPEPDVLIYLRASIPTLVAQIKRRGRAYEMNIDEQYLSRLNEKYEEWINNIYKGRVLIIDKDVDDFVADSAIVDRICKQLDEVMTKK